ncbi:MAG: ABC transporter permease [Thermodesulfobacteriota bacterium]|jgi:putative ABC transport system permease protein
MSRHFHISLNLFGIEAVRALYRNKLRSALAAIGITIGIAAVVCVVAIGTAGSQRAEQQLQNLGDNLVWIEAGSRNVNGVRSGSYGMTSLTMEDAEAILREVSLIKSVSPQVDGSVLIACGNRNWTTHYRGVAPEFLEIRRWELAEGVPFTREDVEHAAKVCMIGQTVRQQLFGAEEAIGRDARINKQIFRVIGVLAPKGQSGTGQDQDDNILMPYTTAQKNLRGNAFTWLNDILCSAVSLEAAKPAIDRINGLLRERHHIRPGDGDDFNIRHPEEVIKAQIATSQTLALFLTSVACISLLVGGIGIMNVMLVSVTQRTREIGLRLAVGATTGAIQIQFLGEAVMLSLFGGLLGVFVGILGSFILGYALGWPVSIPLEALIVAPTFAIGMGIFFGFYPARKAALLDPIAALRRE